MAKSCAEKKRDAGDIMPQCPPKNELQIERGEPEYYLLAFGKRDPYKATYDLLIGA